MTFAAFACVPFIAQVRTRTPLDCAPLITQVRIRTAFACAPFIAQVRTLTVFASFPLIAQVVSSRWLFLLSLFDYSVKEQIHRGAL